MGQALEVANRYYDIWRNKGEGLADVLSDDFSFVGPLSTSACAAPAVAISTARIDPR